jgi:acyl carrier protein
MDEIFNGVKEVILKNIKYDASKITPETKIIDDLKADSMEQFLIIDGICEKFGIPISDDDAPNLKDIKTVGDIVKFVEKQKK